MAQILAIALKADIQGVLNLAPDPQPAPAIQPVGQLPTKPAALLDVQPATQANVQLATQGKIQPAAQANIQQELAGFSIF